MPKKIFLLSALLSITCLSASAFSCSLAGHRELNLDQTLPAIIFEDFEVEVQSIKRGADSGSSCDDLGWVILGIVDVDPEVGYTVELTDGNAPKNLGQYLMPVIPESDGTLTLVWSENTSEDQPFLNFALRVTAIAPNGDTGPSHDVEVSHPGVDGGCSAIGHQDASLLGLMVFGLLFQWRRKG